MPATLTRKGGATLAVARKAGLALAWERLVAAFDATKELALELTSTAENATKDWTTAYAYIEDIGDGRGYTGGVVGWCSGTGDMLILLQAHSVLAPGNVLDKYIPKLQQIMGAAYADRPALSHTLLDPGFTADWATAGATLAFQQAQRNERDRVYWNPAKAQATTDGLGNLGLAIYYDVSVNHGPGSDSQSFGGIVAGVKAAGTKAPAQGGDEKTFLTAIVDARDVVLKGWGDWQANGRSGIHRKLLADNNLTLGMPLSWSVYGDTYSIGSTPTSDGHSPNSTRFTGSVSLSGAGVLNAVGTKSGSTTRATTATLATSPTLTTGA